VIPIPITWVDEPRRGPPNSMPSGSQRYARFINEVGRFAGVSIPLVQGFLREVAPSEGIILLDGSAHPTLVLDECAAEERADLARRLVPIDESRIRIFENLLEPLSLPAAVDGMTLMEWESEDPDKPGAYGPYGRRDIAQLVGASCLMYESERYCYLHSLTHNGLPHLLADYLTAYANAVLV
jgi:hypothetical protein